MELNGCKVKCLADLNYWYYKLVELYTLILGLYLIIQSTVYCRNKC